MNHRQEEEEIRELIKKEHPDMASYEECTFDDLIKEFPQYRRQMIMGDIKIILITCPECQTRMPEGMKEKHKRICKVNRVANQESLDNIKSKTE